MADAPNPISLCLGTQEDVLWLPLWLGCSYVISLSSEYLLASVLLSSLLPQPLWKLGAEVAELQNGSSTDHGATFWRIA